MIICACHRLLASLRAGPASASSHLQTCAACRDWWTRQSALERRLRRPVEPAATRVGFTQDVLRKIERTEQETVLPRRSFLPLAMLGAAASLALVLFLRPAPGPDSPPTLTASPGLLPSLEIPALANLPARVDDPLEQELQLVISDTKNALAFVADHFRTPR